MASPVSASVFAPWFQMVSPAHAYARVTQPSSMRAHAWCAENFPCKKTGRVRARRLTAVRNGNSRPRHRLGLGRPGPVTMTQPFTRRLMKKSLLVWAAPRARPAVPANGRPARWSDERRAWRAPAKFLRRDGRFFRRAVPALQENHPEKNHDRHSQRQQLRHQQHQRHGIRRTHVVNLRPRRKGSNNFYEQLSASQARYFLLPALNGRTRNSGVS